MNDLSCFISKIVGLKKSNLPEPYKDRMIKSLIRVKTKSILMKHNPYHDERGRFTTKDGASNISATEKLKGNTLEKREEKNRIISIRKIENKIWNQSFETLYIIGDNGEVIYKKDGSESRVNGFSPKETKKWKAKTAIHNHPKSTTFSPNDIYACAYLRLRECKVICLNGDIHVLKRIIPYNKYNKNGLSDFLNEMVEHGRHLSTKAFTKAYMNYDINTSDDLLKEKANIYFSQMTEDWIKNNVAKIGYEYKKQKASNKK